MKSQKCGPEETRTPDLLHAMEALYQLSYRPFLFFLYQLIIPVFIVFSQYIIVINIIK